MLRSLAKTAVARAASWSGLDGVVRAHLHRNLPFVLCYHRVVEQVDENGGFALPAMELSVAMLERHLDWLARYFRIISLDDLTAALQEPAGSKPLAAITFDDGYSDVYHHAFPLLRRKGIPAAMFVVTGLVDSDEIPVHERLHALLVAASARGVSLSEILSDTLPEKSHDIPHDPFEATRFLLARLPQTALLRVICRLEDMIDVDDAWTNALQPLTWAMLEEMRAAGMTIGSHSRTHPVLTNEDELTTFDEVEGSRRDLEERLRSPIDCFAYPDGGFNSAIVQAVASAGYRYAFTTCRHSDPLNPMLTIPRTSLWERSCLDPAGRFSPAIMSGNAGGTFNAISRCTQAHA